jgi:hypothetical protein
MNGIQVRVSESYRLGEVAIGGGSQARQYPFDVGFVDDLPEVADDSAPWGWSEPGQEPAVALGVDERVE